MSAAAPAENEALAALGGQSVGKVQELVDRTTFYHLYLRPIAGAPPERGAPGGSGPIGLEVEETVHPLDITTDIAGPVCLRSHNAVGAALGRAHLRWSFIPWEFVAQPGRQPPPTRLDPLATQRFSMQTMEVDLGGGSGFSAWGTGRTFPTVVRGTVRLVVAAVGNLTATRGRLAGRDGNFVLCGELKQGQGFFGHIHLRVVDADGGLAAGGPIAAVEPLVETEPDVVFVTWMAKKGKGPTQQNQFSVTPTGQVRGVNIPVDLWRAHAAFEPAGADALRGRLDLSAETVGLEIGFGRETKARGPDSGSAMAPFQFEGVSRYSFNGKENGDLGTLTANFFEGRTFTMQLAGAPALPALRFSYFGAVMGGTGGLAGARGMLYGSAGSVFLPPPAPHVISNLYVARLFDPEGRFRAAGPATR